MCARARRRRRDTAYDGRLPREAPDASCRLGCCDGTRLQDLEELDVRTGTRKPIDQESSNVLQWITADGTIVSVRPSGTEPKIKFYFGVKEPLKSVDEYDAVLEALDAKIERIKQELKLV